MNALSSGASSSVVAEILGLKYVQNLYPIIKKLRSSQADLRK